MGIIFYKYKCKIIEKIMDMIKKLVLCKERNNNYNNILIIYLIKILYFLININIITITITITNLSVIIILNHCKIKNNLIFSIQIFHIIILFIQQKITIIIIINI